MSDEVKRDTSLCQIILDVVGYLPGGAMYEVPRSIVSEDQLENINRLYLRMINTHNNSLKDIYERSLAKGNNPKTPKYIEVKEIVFV